MTNKNALTLALVLAGLAAASYRYGYKGTAIVAIMAACFCVLVDPIEAGSGRKRAVAGSSTER